MSDIFAQAMADIHRCDDIARNNRSESTYFAPGSTVGITCYCLDESVDTMSDIGGFSVSQNGRVVSAWFPFSVTPQRGGAISIGADSYRVSRATPDELIVSWMLDLEPQ